MYKHNERNGRTFKKGKIRREGGVIEDPIKDANRTKKKKKPSNFLTASSNFKQHAHIFSCNFSAPLMQNLPPHYEHHIIEVVPDGESLQVLVLW